MADHQLNQTATAASDAGGPSLYVRAATVQVASGRDAGRAERIDRPTFIVGTGDEVDLRLTDTTVSREHLRLSLTPEGVLVRDEGSKNGTWLGHARISSVLVTADTMLRVGNTTLGLHVDTNQVGLPVSPSVRFGEASGVSGAMRYVFGLLEKVARSDVTVLLEGESGVGKEVLARAIHTTSGRTDGPVVTVDCGSLPAGVIESELFGHERGAFTGAVAARVGAFEQANGGTLFLDEIGELALDLQPKLLRALEQREVRPVGDNRVRKVDVRVIAATNRRLAECVQRGTFRQDLFYRLAIARVVIPPLRDRPEDIVPLAETFLRAVSSDPSAKVPPDLAGMLRGYSWPGNVRELRNVIQRYAHLGMTDHGQLFDIAPSASSASDLSALPYHEARRIAVEGFERSYVTQALERAGGVVTRAAEQAQIGRATFYRMLDRLQLRAADDDDER